MTRQVKLRAPYLLLFFGVTTFVSCGTDKPHDVTSKTQQQGQTPVDTLSKETTVLKETFGQDDIPANEYLAERLKPIRANFKRINSITNWTSKDIKDIWETTEGGEAIFYYINGQVEKIVAKHFGETFQQLNEYYLFNEQLSFVFEKSYKYNRPVYYDTIAMKENNDSEMFDFGKSEIFENRSYFENGKLIHQLNNQDCGSPFAEDYLQQEQKRIKKDFEDLIKLRTLKQKSVPITIVKAALELAAISKF